jgi:hypothetical protein
MNYALRKTPDTSGTRPGPSGTVQDSVQDKPRQTVEIRQAADIKGMKIETLRKRLQRGQEDGFKSNDGTWKVYVSDVPDKARTVQDSPGHDRTMSRTVQDTTRQAYQDLLESVRARIGDKTGVIDYLKGQIAEKDRQLSAKDNQIAGKDKLIADLVAKLPVIDGDRISELERRNQALEIGNKKNALILKRAYKILRDDLKSEKQ